LSTLNPLNALDLILFIFYYKNKMFSILGLNNYFGAGLQRKENNNPKPDHISIISPQKLYIDFGNTPIFISNEYD
jgi:hypothetical protein